MAAPKQSLSGRLRDRITIRRLTDVPDGSGGFYRGWSTVAENLPSEVVNQSGREAMVANSLTGISAFRIVIRRGVEVRTSDQILFDGMELNVRSSGRDPFDPQDAVQIFADTESPQGAGA